jgi:hypothetical protein
MAASVLLGCLCVCSGQIVGVEHTCGITTRAAALLLRTTIAKQLGLSGTSSWSVGCVVLPCGMSWLCYFGVADLSAQHYQQSFCYEGTLGVAHKHMQDLGCS